MAFFFTDRPVTFSMNGSYFDRLHPQRNSIAVLNTIPFTDRREAFRNYLC